MQVSAAVVVAWVLPGWRAVRAPTVTPVMVSGWGAAPDPCFPPLVYFPPVALDSWTASTSFMCLPVQLYTVTKWDFSGIQGWFNIKSLILTELGGGWIHDHSRQRKHLTKPNVFLKKIRTLHKVRIKENSFNLRKGMYVKQRTSYLMVKNWINTISLRSGMRWRCLLSPLLLNIAL